MIVCPWKDIQRYSAVIPGLEEAMQAVAELKSFEPATIPLSCGKILVQQGTTKPWKDALLEAHREYLDIQYIVEGKEAVGWAPVETLEATEEYNSVKDKCMYKGENAPMEIAAGYCYVVYPEDAHAPGTHLDAPNGYTKLVIKLKV